MVHSFFGIQNVGHEQEKAALRQALVAQQGAHQAALQRPLADHQAENNDEGNVKGFVAKNIVFH